jgi:hypothetical protein
MKLKQGLLIFLTASSGHAFWSKEDMERILTDLEVCYSQKNAVHTSSKSDDFFPLQSCKNFFLQHDIKNLFVWGESVFLGQNLDISLFSLIDERGRTKLPFSFIDRSKQNHHIPITEKASQQLYDKVSYFLKELYYLFAQKNAMGKIKPLQERCALNMIFDTELKTIKKKMEEGISNLRLALEMSPRKKKEELLEGILVLKNYYERKYVRLWFHVMDFMVFDEVFFKNQEAFKQDIEKTLDSVEGSVKELAFFPEIEEWSEDIVKKTQFQQAVYQKICDTKHELSIWESCLENTGFCRPFLKHIENSLFSRSPRYALSFAYFVKSTYDMFSGHGLFLGRPGQLLMRDQIKNLKEKFLESRKSRSADCFKNTLSILLLDSLKALGLKSEILKTRLQNFSFPEEQDKIHLDDSFFQVLTGSEPGQREEVRPLYKETPLHVLRSYPELNWSFIKSRLFIFPMIFNKLNKVHSRNSEAAWHLLADWFARTSTSSRKEEKSLRQKEKQQQSLAISFLLMAEKIAEKKENESLDHFIFSFSQTLLKTAVLYGKQNAFNQGLLDLEKFTQHFVRKLFVKPKEESIPSAPGTFQSYVDQAKQHTLNFLNDGVVPCLFSFESVDQKFLNSTVTSEKETGIQLIKGSFALEIQKIETAFFENTQSGMNKEKMYLQKNLCNFKKAFILHLTLPASAEDMAKERLDDLLCLHQSLENLYPASFSIFQEISFLKANPEEKTYQPKYFFPYQENRFFLNSEGIDKLLSSLKVFR